MSYVTEQRVAALAASLTPREHAIIDTLDRLRVASTSQLRRLHFNESSPHSNARNVRRTLAKLVGKRVLSQLERRVGGQEGGSSEAVFALDAAGQRLASVCGPAGGTRIRRPWTPSQLFLAHSLGVTELFVELSEVAARSGHPEDLLAFDAEPLCWRTFSGAAGARGVLKPDAFCRYAVGDFEDSYFIEIDRATMALTTIARKLDGYRRYLASGREQQRWGVFPAVLLRRSDRRPARRASPSAGHPTADRRRTLSRRAGERRRRGDLRGPAVKQLPRRTVLLGDARACCAACSPRRSMPSSPARRTRRVCAITAQPDSSDTSRPSTATSTPDGGDAWREARTQGLRLGLAQPWRRLRQVRIARRARRELAARSAARGARRCRRTVG